jgi:hypothetical protein
MDKQSEPDRDSARPKTPYRTPRLVTYGNLRELALAKGGTKVDQGPGNPPSKM